ncbi:hypothetical protein Poly51_53480 [Rubripirellula tenax]|uniref:Uncharacterized protein n=1 Tax=Rubripirellula tenax TaxID=2528015 RepID=A0A5C6EFI9_9BACT|nr:MFS transporter [Rubripirellula tenax]TWU47548.1 hypothetical protein Poly51_53480 [Rubripirellula tenax]
MPSTVPRRFPFGRYRFDRVSFCAVWVTLGWFIAMFSLGGWASALAQPPGTLPPDKVFEGQDEDFPIRAFMFLSEAESRVMMPGVTWEEYVRRLDLDTAADGQQQPYSFQSLNVTGTTDDGRAELEVVLRMSIESTEDRWIQIPLRMGNFHRLAPPDVSGVDEFSLSLEPDSPNHVLSVKTSSAGDVVLKMRVSARVQSNSMRMIEFRLPDVPSQVRLTVDASKIDGEVVGRGDETLTRRNVPGNKTQFSVESGGGNFSFRWGTLARSTNDVPLLEVESRVDVRWDSPQDQPIASVRLTVRNAKGSIDGFQLRFPKGSVVLDTPRLGTGGQTIELGAPADEPSDPAQKSAADSGQAGGEVRSVIIPDEERQQRIDLNFDLQLAADNTSSQSPLNFRAIDVVGALRHRGEITLQTGGDYRLRWRTRPWVRSEPSESPEKGLSGRFYRFRFDRGSFELPLWLSAKERQTRVTTTSELQIRDEVASIVMEVQASGQATDGRLQIDEADWKISSIENVETGEPIESFKSDIYRIIDFNLSSDVGTTSFRIRAQRPIEEIADEIRLAIPRVVSTEENVLVQNATLNLIGSGRTLLVVDLENSKGLTRTGSSTNEIMGVSSSSTFRMLSPDVGAVLVGNLVEQPPRITLSSDATIELDGDQLRSTVDWIVTSPLDLEGRLPIRIAKPVFSPTPKNGDPSTDVNNETFGALGLTSNGLDRFDGASTVASEPWVVTVDGVPATLRSLDDDRFELISERLASGTMAIRWRHAQTRLSSATTRATESVSLPRPNFADVTVRGAIRVNLRGNQQYDLTSTDTLPVSTLDLDTLPREPLRLRLQSRLVTADDITVRQAMLRTVVGRLTRQEQVVARVQGGDVFQVDLPPDTPDVSVEALIDDVRIPVQRQSDSLIVPLPGNRNSHVVDLRVWIAMPTSPSFARIQPMLKLPIGIGRVYWQIIAPIDGHIVWASPTVGRSMSWRFDGWRLDRVSTHTDSALSAMMGSSPESYESLPPGNRYLYVGSDTPSFNVVIVSRTILWICVGSFVLLLAVLLTHVPKSRHPLTALAIAVLFAGLLAVAPDAAVLAGQLGMIALVLVIVMIAIRTLISPSGSSRVFTSQSSGPVASPVAAKKPSSSTRTVQLVEPEPPSVASTRTIAKSPEVLP